MKWLWRFGHEVSDLWQRVIATKYREGKGGWSIKVSRGLMVVVWYSISKGWRFFSQHMALVAGEGTHVLFGMIGGPKTLHLRFYILIYLSVQVLMMLVFLMFWVTRVMGMIEFGT